MVLIPYQQGGLFRPYSFYNVVMKVSLNPLSAGRSFQTYESNVNVDLLNVLIPYQQGGLFRPLALSGL